MAVFLQQHNPMKNIYILTVFLLSFSTLVSCQTASATPTNSGKPNKHQNIIYFNPEIFPDIEEIKESTYSAFYDAVSARELHLRNYKMLRVDSNIPFDSVDAESIKEFCVNNNANYAVIPKVKYFKVGLGKYIFSNQVIVSMKLYDATGNFISETDYDTFKKNARILGSAENSIKIGTLGAMNSMTKNLYKIKKGSAN